MYYNPSEWSYAAKQGYHSVYKLEIEALSGATNLYLQFNYSVKKKMEDEHAYRTFLIMMYNSIAWRYKEKGLNKYSNETFYYVRCTDNFSGFCISIKYETAENADDAFPIVELGLNFVLNFNPLSSPNLGFFIDELVLSLIFHMVIIA